MRNKTGHSRKVRHRSKRAHCGPYAQSIAASHLETAASPSRQDQYLRPANSPISPDRPTNTACSSHQVKGRSVPASSISGGLEVICCSVKRAGNARAVWDRLTIAAVLSLYAPPGRPGRGTLLTFEICVFGTRRGTLRMSFRKFSLNPRRRLSAMHRFSTTS